MIKPQPPQPLTREAASAAALSRWESEGGSVRAASAKEVPPDPAPRRVRAFWNAIGTAWHHRSVGVKRALALVFVAVVLIVRSRADRRAWQWRRHG
jgi:hypothetical protein